MSLTTGYEAETLPGNDKGTGKYSMSTLPCPTEIGWKLSDYCLLLIRITYNISLIWKLATAPQVVEPLDVDANVSTCSVWTFENLK